jgi:hypothetical protein
VPKAVSVGACTGEFKNNNDSALLHHQFFCKGEWVWWCRVIAILIPQGRGRSFRGDLNIGEEGAE